MKSSKRTLKRKKTSRPSGQCAIAGAQKNNQTGRLKPSSETSVPIKLLKVYVETIFSDGSSLRFQVPPSGKNWESFDRPLNGIIQGLMSNSSCLRVPRRKKRISQKKSTKGY